MGRARLRRIGAQIARGLAAAHAKGVIHRDIKPANILLEGTLGRVKITDFGLARAADDANLTQSGYVAGTPMFMAPEQADGQTTDHRADLFSLGSVLYMMCTGRPPFARSRRWRCSAASPRTRPVPSASLFRRRRAGFATLSANCTPRTPTTALRPRKKWRKCWNAAQWPAGKMESAPNPAASGGRLAVQSPARSAKRFWLAAAALLLGVPALALVWTEASGVTHFLDRARPDRVTHAPSQAPVEIAVARLPDADDVVAATAEQPKEKDAERKVAEWVLSIGGRVKVNDQDTFIHKLAELPEDVGQLNYISLLDNPRVTDVGLAGLKGCKFLTGLNLAGTPVTDTGFSQLENLVALRELYLDRTSISDAGTVNLPHYQQLVKLGLFKTAVTDDTLLRLKSLKELYYLHLWDTKITDVGLSHLAGHEKLLSLYLSATPVSDQSIPLFQSLKGLRLLLIDETAITPDGEEELRQTLPNCQIRGRKKDSSQERSCH